MSPISSTKELNTWSGSKRFRYSRSASTGIEIWYGKGFKYRIKVRADKFEAILKEFAGQEVPIGTNHTTPPPNSVGEWLIAHVSKTSTASYVGPILIEEHYAAVGTTPDRIRFC
jgi:hypothetical protein